MATIDLGELALSIARIASETEDPITARQLVELVYDLLAEAGLPILSSEPDLVAPSAATLTEPEPAGIEFAAQSSAAFGRSRWFGRTGLAIGISPFPLHEPDKLRRPAQAAADRAATR